MIPEKFRAVACPEPTLEQYAAVKLEAGIGSGVKKFKKDQKAGNLLHMEMEALEGLVKQRSSEKGRLKTTGLDDEQYEHTEVWMQNTKNDQLASGCGDCPESKIPLTDI